MKLAKAIEILQEDLNYGEGSHEFDLEDAIKLGIEALKRCKTFREQDLFQAWILLPGETKDYCKFCGLAHTDIECPSREGEK